MSIDDFFMMFGALFVWSSLGVMIAGVFEMFPDADGFNYVNPIWIYKHYNVNYFGAALIFILYNLICPIGSICYWLYKLCTVGRK